MVGSGISDPLIAIDAIAIDTEATGLDPARARVVEIGAIHLTAGAIDTGATLRRLVNPGEPIPPGAAAIHGITDETVAGAPPFREAWLETLAFAGDKIWIGHTLGFDLALIARECTRASIPFEKPRVLDTRLLAQVAEPNLSGYTLESLSAWLGVETAQRHAALGDAITTARVFIALLPRLRERGIRTIGEALRASSRLTDVLDGQHRAGWIEVAEAPAAPAAPAALQRLDSFPYRCRIGEIMSSPPAFITADATIKDAMDRMMSARISSLFATTAADGAIEAASCGIVTERDILRAISARGSSALDTRVGDIMSRPLATVPASAFLYVAIARMNRLRIRHLGVVGSTGEIAGALSARDLLRSRAGEALTLGDEMDTARDARQLAIAWSKLPRVCAALKAEEMEGRDIAAIVSHEVCALTSRATAIAERSMREAGLGEAPCSYAVLVLGSAGRGESLLAMDQDNAIVFSQGDPDGPEDKWFETLGARFADILHEAGVPLCKGGVMAKNPQFRGSLDTWRARIGTWLERSRPQDLLSVDTFFDLQGVGGDLALAARLRTEAFEAAQGRNAFAKLLVDSAPPADSALGLFGRFKTVDGRIDLKKSGLFRIVCAARALAIRHNILAFSTPGRLQAIRELGRGGDQDLEAIMEAQGLFLDLIARQQLADISSGHPPSNTIEIGRLSRFERERLQQALRSIDSLETLVRDLMFAA